MDSLGLLQFITVRNTVYSYKFCNCWCYFQNYVASSQTVRPHKSAPLALPQVATVWGWATVYLHSRDASATAAPQTFVTELCFVIITWSLLKIVFSCV